MTIPQSVVSELGLNVGDQFEVVIQDGNIVLIPIVVYPKAKLESLIELATQAREELKSGKQKYSPTSTRHSRSYMRTPNLGRRKPSGPLNGPTRSRDRYTFPFEIV